MSEESGLQDRDAQEVDRRDEWLRDPQTRFILFRGDRALLETDLPIRPVLITPAEAASQRLDFRDAVHLGVYEAGPLLTVDLGEAADEACEEDLLRGTFRRLRTIQEPVDHATWELLSRASALLAWNRQYAACPVCGSVTIAQNGGTLRVCSNAACGRDHHPRTDPTVIVRVVSGEKCLLGRQPQFAPGLRSVIAGFVEPGETLEGAVRREVEEEVGIVVERVAYLGSQPWPFPMNLMIAFEAHAEDEAIRIDTQELEAADWYTRDRVKEEVSAGALVLPSRKSIARWMIDTWLEDLGD
ncbi:NAD(+) diphosphatase [Candidatus Bipolaricaulota bacterium]|nr:NAD(+) diphosphatase [Candidatus Bipolaricaulota bacterium]